jgi:MFS family permease
MPQEHGKCVAELVGAPGQEQRMFRSLLIVKGFLRRTFSALRHRNFRLFFVGQLVSLIGSWMQSTAQGWLVYQLTGSKLMLGLVAAAGSAPMLLFSVWGGSLADRYSKRVIVLCAQTVMMLTALSLAALVWTARVEPWHIMILCGMAGLAMAFDLPARQSFMVEITSRDDLTNAIGLNSSIVNSARIIGPSAAGFIMAGPGIAVCFLVNGLSYLAVIAGLLLMRLPVFVAPFCHSSAWAHIMEGLRYVWENRRMRVLLLLFAAVGVFGWSYAVLMPAFGRDVLETNQQQYGILLGSSGVGALMGALTVAAFAAHTDRRWLVLGGLCVFAFTLFLLAMVRNFYVALACLAVGGWGLLLFFSTVNTLLQTSSSDQMRGRVMGIWALVFGGTTPVGGLLAGTLSHYFGVSWALAIGASVCALAAALAWKELRFM